MLAKGPAVWPGGPHPLWVPLWKGSKADLPWQSPAPGRASMAALCQLKSFVQTTAVVASRGARPG